MRLNTTRLPVSIVIPTYNGLYLLTKHLPSVFNTLTKNDEVIIVDDASTDKTVAELTKLFTLLPTNSAIPDTTLLEGNKKGIKVFVLINQSNQRFASSCNRGVAIASSEYVMLLNNDVSPSVDIFSFLLPHFQNSQVFAVGCKERSTTENNKEYGRSEGKFIRGFLVHWRAENQDGTDTLWASGGSSLFRKSLWDQLGGFDLDYTPAYYEDTDLSYKARKRGYRIVFEPRALVDHTHETTHASVFGQSRMEIMSFKNAFLFVWKNGSAKELLAHVLWLPYHLVFTTYRSRGRFLSGFIAALATLLE